jgi:2-hydroxychromene-2-carboxylate isomerase
MSLKSVIAPPIIAYVFGEKRQAVQRKRHERQRKRAGEPHQVEFFHDPSDPYSQLLKQVLPEFKARYDVTVTEHSVSPPNDVAAPEREKLATYAQRDAALIAAKAGIDFTYHPAPPAKHSEAGNARLEALGHYMGGMLHYAGEWYWGLDRLHYLEARLRDLGAAKDVSLSQPIFAPPQIPSREPNNQKKSGRELHAYLSFRSPYSAIVLPRAQALAQAYGAKLVLRIVLPMVMRGLPVPKAKKAYILPDTAREARRLGVPYGKICDPVGRPIERAYALFLYARAQGREIDFANAFYQMVWAEGVNAGSDRGLRRITERAGLDWRAGKANFALDDWREEAETNQREMMARGIWGVPSFRVDDTIIWGQDRLWVIEDALKLEQSSP